MFVSLGELKAMKQLTSPAVLFRLKPVLFVPKRSAYRLQTRCYELHN
jgi:hypothetical protein